MRFLFALPIQLIRLLLNALFFLTPVLGVWLASSLVAYSNGPTWLAVFSGILLFPLIPITWDLLGRRRRKRPGGLTWDDRIAFRTLILNLAFIICLLALRPQTAFLALSTRGDWMLDSFQGAQTELVREGLFKLANRLEWLYTAVRQNPYEVYADLTSIKPAFKFNPFSQPKIQPPPKTTSNSPGAKLWSQEGSSIHPAVANMPASVETSIKSVAEYIAEQEKDPFLRVKALHDYVADRVTYDVPAFFGQVPRPSQDAQTVFRTHKAVCAGYSKLLEALGQAIGEEIVYIVGDSRSQVSDIGGGSHAWNAVKIGKNWYLMDATWDSGYIDASGFTKKYSTEYLFPPPEVMAISHFPEDSSWQLLPKPLSRGEFLRQPMLRPHFFADGLKLISPTRSQTDVKGEAVIQLSNPQQRWLMASYGVKGSPQLENCTEETTQGTELSCPLPATGTYEVKLFSGEQQYGQYKYVGQLEFNKG